MGPDRHPQDSHAGPGPTPKLTWAGRLDGHAKGRPVSLLAQDRDLILSVDKLRTLFTLLPLRKSWLAITGPLRGLFEHAGLRLLVQTPWFGKVEVFPRPSYPLRLLLPRS